MFTKNKKTNYLQNGHNLSWLIYFLLIAIIVIIPTPSNAQQTTADAINQQDWITRNQQNILEETRRNKELEDIEKDRARKKAEEKQELESSAAGKPLACYPCFQIKKIKLNGANYLSNSRQQELVAPFIGECFEAKILSEVVAAVNAYYQSIGNATAQVIVPQQNLQSGIFELKIIEGKIEKILLGQDKFTDKMQEFAAFGMAEGKTLNLKDVNQGMYQINRLQSNAAVMKIEPGSADGLSKIVIENNKRLPLRLTAGKDNLGNKFTGVQRTTLSSSLDNLLSLNDNINLNYATNLHDNNKNKDIKSFNGGLSIPFKYNTFSYDYSHSEFKGHLDNATESEVTGFSKQNKVTIDRVLLNTVNLRLSTNASLTAKQSASTTAGVANDNSQRRLSVLNLGFAASYHFNDTTSLYLKPSYSKGLKVLNALQDQKNIGASVAKAQFEVFKFYASASKKITIPKINAPIILTTELDSQYAKQTLYGSEQFSVGGYYSVRGFRETYISGDSGYYLRNKANFNIGSLIAPLFSQESSNFFIKNISQLKKFKFEPFYDFGYVRNKYNGSEGRLAGAGAKGIFESRYFNASLTYSWAVNKSNLSFSPEKENNLVFFEISTSCC